MTDRLDDRRTLAEQVADDLRGKIRDGEYAPGSRLLSTRSMADVYQVSGQTVQTALDLLRQEGLVDSVPGRATFVRHDVDPASITSPSSSIRPASSSLREKVDDLAHSTDELVARIAAVEERLDQLEGS